MSKISGAPGRPAGAEQCLGCRLCQDACPAGAVGFDRGRPEVGPGCLGCAACLEVCPAGVFEASAWAVGH